MAASRFSRVQTRRRTFKRSIFTFNVDILVSFSFIPDRFYISLSIIRRESV